MLVYGKVQKEPKVHIRRVPKGSRRVKATNIIPYKRYDIEIAFIINAT